MTSTDLQSKLKSSGLRPTRQRLAIAEILFANGHRHVSAEGVHDDLKGHDQSISLATVYNTLNQFTEAGLLRQITISANKSHFDTNLNDHHHYFLEHEQRLVDIPHDCVTVDNLPKIPEGMEVSSVDVVIRLRRKSNSQPS